VEPVHLQVVCRDLWEKRDPADPDITVDEIEKIGDVDDALGSYYDNQVGAITVAEKVTEWKVRTWCGTRLITESDIRSQVLMGPEESGGLANTAIQRLVDAHLVRREPRRGSIWFELAHDRLIAPIRRSNARWSEEHLSPWQRQAALWEAEHRAERLLLGGETLDEAIEWASENAGQLSEEEVQFLDASKRHAQALQLDAERRRARTQQRFLILIGLALVAAVVLGIYSAFQTVRADRRGYDLATQIAISEENAATLSVAEAQARDEKGTAQAERGIAQAERGTADALRVTAVAQSTVAAGLKEEADANALLAGQLAAVNFARQLAVQGNSLLDSQPDLAGLLAAESYAITPTLEGRSLLLDLALLGLGQEVQPFGFPIPEPESLLMVMDLSPDGERLAWGTLQGYVAVWNYRTNAVEWNQRLHTGNVISLDFSPDGKWLASGGIRPELRITDVTSGEEVINLSEHVTNRIYSLAFHPSQSLLAIGIFNTISIWSTGDRWREVIEFKTEPDWILELAWSPDGDLLASGEAADAQQPNGGLVVWDPLTGQKKLSVGYERTINGLAWSQDGVILTVGSSSGIVRRWDMSSGREVPEPFIHQGEDTYGISLSPDGKILATGGLDPYITLYNTRDNSVFWSIRNAEDEFVRDLKFAPQKGTNLLATLYENWRTGRRRIALSVVTPQNPLSREIAKLPTKIEGIGGSLETGLRLLRSTADGILVEELPLGGQGAPQAIYQQSGEFEASTISQSGDQLALWGQDDIVTLYELGFGEQTGSFSLETLFDQSLAFSPDGSRLAISVCGPSNIRGGRRFCHYWEIQLWDTHTEKRTSHPDLRGQYHGISFLAFSADGSKLASGSNLDKNILIWDLVDLNPDGVLLAATVPISSLAFSPDGSTLASGSTDGDLVLWDLDSRLPIGSPLLGGHGGVSALTYEADGSLLAGYEDGSLLQWLVFPENLLEIACGKADRGLTDAEQEQYFPQGGYRNACGK
jgi:WD40 repeat protein